MALADGCCDATFQDGFGQANVPLREVVRRMLFPHCGPEVPGRVIFSPKNPGHVLRCRPRAGHMSSEVGPPQLGEILFSRHSTEALIVKAEHIASPASASTVTRAMPTTKSAHWYTCWGSATAVLLPTTRSPNPASVHAASMISPRCPLAIGHECDTARQFGQCRPRDRDVGICTENGDLLVRDDAVAREDPLFDPSVPQSLHARPVVDQPNVVPGAGVKRRYRVFYAVARVEVYLVVS